MSRMRQWVVVLAVVFVTTGGAAAFNVEYVGSITDQLAAPTGLAVGCDHIAVLEPLSRRITIYTADGIMTHRLDLAGDALGLAQISETGYLLCDREARDVVAVDCAAGTQSSHLAGGADFADPVDVIATPWSSYILDAGRNEICIADRQGAVTSRIALQPPDDTPIGYAISFAYDDIAQTFYIFDQLTACILAYSQSGEYLGRFGAFGADDGEVTRGGEIACDRDGYIYVTDRFQGRIVVFDSGWEFVANIDPVAFGQRAFNVPTGIAVDDDGLVYAASTEDRRVHIFAVTKAARSRAPAARGVYPEDRDTVVAAGLELIAGVEIHGDDPTVTGIDFQLFAASDTVTPLAETLDRTPVLLPGSDAALTAAWPLDIPLATNALYGWRVRARADELIGDWSPIQWFTTAITITDYRLEQNYPNPFNPRTVIFFEMPLAGSATLTVYNLLGQKVWQQAFDNLPPGRHQTTWGGTDSNGRPTASGVYFYRLAAGDFVATRKMVLLR
ncbi:MAG TPA: T9SS type A sorting domain-containing protein [Acidobacteriota bacterium]|nr:T9SS type A sorting domain-containing protein [Acidobacteriota bacterium]